MRLLAPEPDGGGGDGDGDGDGLEVVRGVVAGLAIVAGLVLIIRSLR